MEAGFIPAGAGLGGGGGIAQAQGPPLLAAPPPAPVVRAPGLKRGKTEEAISDRIKLETVFGLTVGSNAALDCDPNTELVAYPAGCTVVLYNVRKNRQSHVVNTARKSVTCVAFSPDGRYLATGECGHAPAARVWDLQDPTASGAVQIAEFPGHTHGVSCVSFSTSSKYLVSVGSQHDMIVNVWDWRANLKLASNKVSSRVKAVSFSESGNYFVTVGFRHVKFWYLEYSRNAKIKEPVPLMGRSAILGEQKDNEFCDVACGRGDTAQSTFAITRGGLLAEFNARRLLDKWVELRTTSANCMAIGSRYIVVGCAEGIVRVFEPRTLQYVTTLPRTHYLGADVARGTHISHMFNVPPSARYPDAVALTYDERNHKLTAVYNDHSLYVWDVRDIKRVGKSHSALYHSACIWGVEMVSETDGVGAGVGAGATETETLPPGTFLTCSSDDTVRAWHLKPSAPNIYSNELTKVMYIDPELKFLTDADLTSAADKDKAKTYDDKTGVRCVRVSWDGAHVAAGDRAGNVWVHHASGRLLTTLEAHDAEVLCLEYSPPPYTPRLLATASRDRLIHVFLVDKGYQILQTLDEHSSSITAVRFLPPAPPPPPPVPTPAAAAAAAAAAPPLQMVSCGADKTILFRQLKTAADGSVSFARGLHAAGRCTLYDMEVETGGRHVLAACQDRNVRVYSAHHARHTKTFRGTPADDGTLIKVALDSSGIYLATSSTDKLLSVYDYYSGELMATMYGHSEIATGLKFTADCQHLVSAAGDGCVFVWRVPHDMVVTMRARRAQQAMRHGRRVGPVTNGAGAGGNGVDSDDSAWGSRDGGDRVTPDLTLRVGKLPSWAAKSLGDGGGGGGGGGGATPPALGPAPPAPARGKWAQRMQPHEKRADSDGSKDSSLDSGTDTLYIEKRQQTKQRPKSLNLSQLPRVEALFRHFDLTMKQTMDMLSISPRVEKVTINTSIRNETRTKHLTDDSSLGSFKYEDHESTEHDGDIEDISDGERTSSSERGSRPTYYPGNNDDGTSFMVNAMDAEELRASVRRVRRGGGAGGGGGRDLPPAASLSGSPHDSDDEVSTPSGDAERGILSGSCESLDAPPAPAAHAHSHAHGRAHGHTHTHSRREMLLKTAFDSLSTTDLHTQHGHKSLSSQHRAPAAPRSPQGQGHSKAVDPEAARRREELNRRILETRRQLENVAYRSHLKSSQSTTDLSYIPEKEGRRRPVSMAVSNNARHHGFTPEETLDSLNSNFYDSLNPTLNHPLDYRNKNPYAIPANLNHKIPEYLDNAPPYVPPHGNLAPTVKERKNTNFLPFNKPVIFKEERPLKPLAFTVEMRNNKPIQSKVFNRLFPTKDSETPKIAPRNFHLNLPKNPEQDRSQKTPKGNARSIFKNYKSCPVSPVSEECKWSDKSTQNRQMKPNTTSLDPKKRNSLSFFIGLDGKCLKDNGKSIVDTIKSDTERMIAEITKKYGDLDEYDVSAHDDLDLHPTKEDNLRDDGNFSSDSLEDCSLSQELSCKNKLYSKKVCKKHAKTKSLPRRSVSNYEIGEKPVVPVKPSYIMNQKSSTLPRNMPSNLDEIVDVEDFNMNPNYMYRCQSVLTKRCVTRSNESVLSDTSNGSSVSNEIFMKYGNEVAFQQAKYDSRYNLDSQNCSFENINEPDASYLDNHRHSSASFFLNQKKYMKPSCSQESILSDDMYLDENQLSRTNCNSLESVLSDDSECTKSAPLEMLFEGSRAKKLQKNQSVNIPRNSKSCYEFDNTSKSYGSSPNTVPSFANHYMYSYLGTSPKSQQKVQESVAHKPVNKVYGFDVPAAESKKAVPEFSGHRTVTRSKSVHDSTQPPPAKNIAYYFDGSNVQAYTKAKATKDEIPRLNTALDNGNTSKSLHPDFTDKYKSTMEGCEPKTMVKSKSCSFEVVLEPASKPNPIKNLIEKRNSHVQKNLEKFEEQIRKNQQNKVSKNQLNKERANSKLNATKSLERGSNHKNNSKITMEFVPHKPPKPAKRTSSVKLNNRLKAGDKPTLSSSISSQYKAKLDGLHNKNFLTKKESIDSNSNIDTDTVDTTEKTFDIFVKEKDVNENRSEIQMDSLEVFALQRIERMKQLSMDSLDILEDTNDFAQDSLDYYSEQKNRNLKCLKEQNNIRTKTDATPSHSRDSKENIAPLDEIKKYKYIERKLQIINKLVEMEERKILQEKVLKEYRMRPLKANINDGKGVVKVLSRKFEKLAKKQTVPNFTSLTLEEADTDTENSENKEIKRNLSLPDILDSDQIGVINTCFDNEAEIGNESGNIIDDTELDETKPNADETNTDSKTINAHVKNLNNTVKETSHSKFLKHRVHNEMVYPKTDVHLDSENYESSTTSSSCTNSPKRMMFYGFNRLKTPFRKAIRIPTPRLCMARCPEMLSLPRSPIKRAVPIPALAKTQARPLAPSDGEEEGGMRRAISLSDLAKPTPAPRGTAQSKLSSACAVAAVKSPSGFLRPAPRHALKGNMTRSSSVGVLNHSDSESDGGDRRGSRGGGGGVQAGGAVGGAGLMRPTISSLNKQAQAARRRTGPHSHSHSQASLSAGQQESSSDADETAGRAPMDTRMGRSGSERDLSAKAREVTARLAAPAVRPRAKPAPAPPAATTTAAAATAPLPTGVSAITTAPDQNLSGPELCAMLTAQLVGAARRVAALHRSLRRASPHPHPHTHTHTHPARSAPHPALTELEAAILETQRVLRGAVGGGRSNGDGSPDPDSGGEAMDATRQRLSSLTSEASTHPAMALIDQYSDKLLNMLQNKMVPQTNSQTDHSPHS